MAIRRTAKKGNKRLLILVALLAIVLLIIYMLPGMPAGDDNAAAGDGELPAEFAATTLVRTGDAAPDFTVEMLDGTSLQLSSLRGKVVLVNFWATWCPPCREELSHVQEEIVDRYAGEEFAFVAISRGEERAVVEKFMADKGYHFPAGLDPQESIYKLYATQSIPRNFLIDRDGRIAYIGVGYDKKEFSELVGQIEKTLNNK